MNSPLPDQITVDDVRDLLRNQDADAIEKIVQQDHYPLEGVLALAVTENQTWVIIHLKNMWGSVRAPRHPRTFRQAVDAVELLYLSCENGNAEAAGILLDVLPRGKDERSRTITNAFSFAATNNHVEIVQKLLPHIIANAPQLFDAMRVSARMGFSDVFLACLPYANFNEERWWTEIFTAAVERNDPVGSKIALCVADVAETRWPAWFDRFLALACRAGNDAVALGMVERTTPKGVSLGIIQASVGDKLDAETLLVLMARSAGLTDQEWVSVLQNFACSKRTKEVAVIWPHIDFRTFCGRTKAMSQTGMAAVVTGCSEVLSGQQMDLLLRNIPDEGWVAQCQAASSRRQQQILQDVVAVTQHKPSAPKM